MTTTEKLIIFCNEIPVAAEEQNAATKEHLDRLDKIKDPALRQQLLTSFTVVIGRQKEIIDIIYKLTQQ